MLTIILIIVLFICFIHLALNYNSTARLMRKIPGPKETFIFGHALKIMVSPVELFALGRQWSSTFKDIYRFYAFPVASVNIYNPEDVETITSNMKYHEKSLIYKFLEPWLKEGLLISNGTKWQHRRKVLTSAFHFDVLKKYFDSIDGNSQRLVRVLQQTNGQSVDVVPILSEYTLNTICESAMGTALSDESSSEGKMYKTSIYQMGHTLFQRFINIYLHPDFIFNLSFLGRKQKQHLSVIHNFTKNVIKNRRKLLDIDNISETKVAQADGNISNVFKKKKAAMLDLLLLAEKEELIDGDGIQEEVDTFMFEGHDTTQAALTYCLMSLANEEFVQQKAYAEQECIFAGDNRPATLADLTEMTYLECCIKESLRLYPPVPFISRKINEPTTLSNYTIPAGASCHIHIYDLHRQESIYKNALKFDPDRFLKENSVGRHTYAYIPFSAGPRNCIGQKFAMMEMKSSLSAVLRNFKLVPVTSPDDLCFISDIVLRNHAPVYVKFIKRNK
ncbi:cytochrome P450 4C1-like [Danaus plexippus]|uniref:cytochrome P450 4C1-like n=1 Tax=Danaus plexippus TaxID=13037 RepID=UPI002AB02DD2|nr:cytochrome P450 4C1-like [Danaus plexippus]